MPKTLSSNDAKQGWGAPLGYVSERGEAVIVESHGKPKAVVVPVAGHEELLTLREQRRPTDALERLRALNERISARHRDREETEEEVIAFADRLSHELIDDMAARGEITFERDRP